MRYLLKIRWAGKLSEAEMDWCYSNCSLFVMTSRVESFGLTGVEALSHEVYVSQSQSLFTGGS